MSFGVLTDIERRQVKAIDLGLLDEVAQPAVGQARPAMAPQAVLDQAQVSDELLDIGVGGRPGQVIGAPGAVVGFERRAEFPVDVVEFVAIRLARIARLQPLCIIGNRRASAAMLAASSSEMPYRAETLRWPCIRSSAR